MKRILSLFITCMSICGCGYNAEHMAELYVKANYADYHKPIYCDVDTITYGDNLDFRIERMQYMLKSDTDALERYKSYTYMPADMRKQHMDELEKSIRQYKWRIDALDSLRRNSELLNQPTAYLVCIAYNQPNNLVWVQMDEYYELLKISKRREDMLINPGNDIPGYFEIITAELPLE